MALVPCPACGLPRAAADADSPCPTCAWADPAPAPTPPPPPPVVAPVPEVVHPRNNWLYAAGGLVAAGALVLVLWPTPPPPLPEPDPTPPPPAEARVEPPLAVAVPVREPAPEPVIVPVVVPVVVPVPVPVPVQAGDGFAVLKFDQPDELFHFPRLDAGNRVRLVGRVKRLIVEGVEGGSELDATGLANEGVSIYGKVDGGSTLRLKTAAASLTFKEGVRGGSVLELDAPKAYVSFPAIGSGGKAGSVIGGGSRLRIHAKAVVVGVPVLGAGTELDITFSAGGSLKLAAVEGGAMVRYRPEHRADPAVKVTTTRLAGGGEVREEPPPR